MMKNSITIFILLAAATSHTVSGMGEMLTKPHRTITQHQQLCIPGADIVQCDKDASNYDKANIMYNQDGQRMFTWNEYSVVKSASERSTAVWSTIMEAPEMKEATATTGLTNKNGLGMEMWKERGTVTEDDVTYSMFVLSYDEAVAGNQDALKQRQVVDSGLLPDRWEYLEKLDGTPYVTRLYSGRNKNTMYQETKFMMVEELNPTEIEDPDTAGLAMNMAVQDIPTQRRRMLRKRISSVSKEAHRRTQLEFETGVPIEYQEIEFPPNCLENDRAKKCMGISRSIDLSAVSVEGSDVEVLEGLEATYRVDAVIRDSNDRSAELFGEVVMDANTGELLFVQGAARGCASPASVKIGDLTELSVTKCMSGDITWEDGTVTGRLELSAQCKAEVANFEGTIELAGFIEVMARLIDGRNRFTGFEGGISLTADADVLALGLEVHVIATPNDIRRGDDWVTTINLIPSLEYDLGLFSGSLSYNFRLAQIGPQSLARTDSPRPPRTPLPEHTRLRSSDKITDGVYRGRSYPPFSHWYAAPRGERNEVVRGFQLSKSSNSIDGIRFWYDGVPSSLIGAADNYKTTTQVLLAGDEYIVRIAGFWVHSDIQQLVIDTNKGRTFDYRVDRPCSRCQFFVNNNFDFVAEDGEALYTVDAYLSVYDDRIVDFEAQWGEAPEPRCSQDSCVTREGAVGPSEQKPNMVEEDTDSPSENGREEDYCEWVDACNPGFLQGLRWTCRANRNIRVGGSCTSGWERCRVGANPGLFQDQHWVCPADRYVPAGSSCHGSSWIRFEKWDAKCSR